MRYLDALKEGRRLLEEAGIAPGEAAVDSRMLLEFASGRDRTFLFAHGDEEVSEEGLERYSLLIKERGNHVPAQLLTGYTDFMGLNFKVSEGVLIPRIDTEFLVEEAMRFIPDYSSVLDLCTGSGCVLLSLMSYKNGIEGTGTDISDAALALAGENAGRLGLECSFIKSDLFDEVKGCFDFILSNPPYIRSSEIEGLMEEVRLHDPLSALDGGADGLDFYRRIAGEAPEHLSPGGMLFLEIGHDEGEAVAGILEGAGFSNIEVLKDYSGNERVVECSRN